MLAAFWCWLIPAKQLLSDTESITLLPAAPKPFSSPSGKLMQAPVPGEATFVWVGWLRCVAAAHTYSIPQRMTLNHFTIIGVPDPVNFPLLRVCSRLPSGSKSFSKLLIKSSNMSREVNSGVSFYPLVECLGDLLFSDLHLYYLVCQRSDLDPDDGPEPSSPPEIFHHRQPR